VRIAAFRVRLIGWLGLSVLDGLGTATRLFLSRTYL
jgi:hypothetical protein